MLSFLASFTLHLLCNEILLNSQGDVQTQKRNTGMPVKERQQSVRVRALFKIHWFWNAAEMQKHSWEVQDQIIVTAVLSLPKGDVAFTSPGFLLVIKSCPLLAQALVLVKLFARLDSVGWSYPIHFACWDSFPLFCLAERAQVQEEPEAGDRSAWWGAHSCEQMAELSFSFFKSSNQWDQLTI